MVRPLLVEDRGVDVLQAQNLYSFPPVHLRPESALHPLLRGSTSRTQEVATRETGGKRAKTNSDCGSHDDGGGRGKR